jgi:signal transduction histidine kinase
MLSRRAEILLIEDNQEDVDLARQAFSAGETPVNLHVLSSGEQAVSFLARTGAFTDAPTPDLILLDLGLPGMTGSEVLGHIKNRHEYRSIPVIVLTVSSTEHEITRSYAQGASCHIVKPVDPAEFSRVLGKIQDFWCATVELPRSDRAPRGTVSTLAPVASPRKEPAKELHVLYVEDSDEDFDLVDQSLASLREPRFAAHREVNLSGALNYLASNHVDVVLLDLSLPDSTALDTVVRFHAQSPLVPVVVLTGTQDKALGVRSVQEGADDYLVKSQFQTELLGRTLLHAIERKIIVLDRLAALAVEHEARSKAEHAVGIRDEFLSIASHELRNPLAAVQVQIQVLFKILGDARRDDLFSDHVQTLAARTDRQIGRFSQLIDTLLDFSTIQSGRLRLERSRFDVIDLVRESVERLGPELKSAGCSVVVDAGAPVEGEWDRLRIEQVLHNLLSNAMKYARGKPLSVSVNSDKETVWIRVRDQGPGIAPGDLDRVFLRYERGLHADKSYLPGLGLGLYVARQIMDAHGGGIRVESELGKGATFVVQLPRRSTAALALSGTSKESL